MHKLVFVPLKEPDEKTQVSTTPLPKGAKVVKFVGRIVQSAIVRAAAGPHGMAQPQGEFQFGLLARINPAHQPEPRYFTVIGVDGEVDETATFIDDMSLPNGAPAFLFELQSAPRRLMTI